MGMLFKVFDKSFANNWVGKVDSVCNYVRGKVNDTSVEMCYMYALNWGCYQEVPNLNLSGIIEFSIGIRHIGWDSGALEYSHICSMSDGTRNIKIDVYVKKSSSNSYISIEIRNSTHTIVLNSGTFATSSINYSNSRLNFTLNTVLNTCSDATLDSTALTFTEASDTEESNTIDDSIISLYIDSLVRTPIRGEAARLWYIKVHTNTSDILNMPMGYDDTLMNFANSTMMIPVGDASRGPIKSKIPVAKII